MFLCFRFTERLCVDHRPAQVVTSVVKCNQQKASIKIKGYFERHFDIAHFHENINCGFNVTLLGLAIKQHCEVSL